MSTHESNVAALEQTEKNLLFIVGSGRCGTTILRAMFDSHPEYAIPSETHLFNHYEQYHRQKFENPATRDQGFVDLFKEDRIEGIRLDQGRVKELLAETDGSWENLFLAMLTTYRESRNRHRAGEKSPKHLVRIEHLHKAYPDAKFIHVVRDPRAVVSSFVNAKFYKYAEGKNPYRAIDKWVQAMKIHRMVMGWPDHSCYATTRYEDLVTQPEVELRRLCEFMSVEFDPNMIDYKNHATVGFVRDEKNRAGIRTDLHQGSLETWRQKIPAKLIAMTEALCGNGMEEFGYKRDTASTSLPVLLEARMLGVAAEVREVAKGLAKKFGAKRDRPSVPVVD
ncbi:hypothetical protein BH11ARM2_BH11ARM2_02330 [soil metagenome]